MIRSVIACVSVVSVLGGCGGAQWAGPSPQELVGCYEVQPSEGGDALPGFRLFPEASAASDGQRAATILANGREGTYPFDHWSLADGRLVVRSSGQSGAILTLSPNAGSMSGTMSYYTDVTGGDELPTVEVESRRVPCS